MPAPADLVYQQSGSTGSGNLTLSAVTGRRTFATAFSTGATTDVFDYFIVNNSADEWEIGTGHMADATTFVRDTVVRSSNSNTFVTFSAGVKDITNDIPANFQCRTSTNTVTDGHAVVFNGTSGNLIKSAGLAFPTTATGSGSLVLATSPSLITPSFSGETFSTSATISAAGTTQATATGLTSDLNVVTTAAASSGVVLPTATVGRRITVINRGANPVNVYPATGAAIDGLAANAALSLPVSGVVEINASSTTQWYSSNYIPYVAPSTSGNILTSNGTIWTSVAPASINGNTIVRLTTQATTANTQSAYAFTSIPSWVKRIQVLLSGVSTNSTGSVLIQIGQTGTTAYQTTNYQSATFSYNSTTATFSTAGFVIDQGTSSGGSGASRSGIITLVHMGSNIWVSSGVIITNNVTPSAGSVTLTAALDKIQITTNSTTQFFDAGNFNIIYEG